MFATTEKGWEIQDLKSPHIQPYILYRILFEVGSYLYVSIDNLVTRIVRLLYPLKL